MNERIREVRDYFHLSRNKFAEKIGCSGGVIQNIEYGRAPITESTVKLICYVYGVSEEWLRTGSGDMFAQSAPNSAADAALEAIANRYHASKTFRAIIDAYSRLTVEQCQALEQYVDYLLDEFEESSGEGGDPLGGMTPDEISADLDTQDPA